MRTGLLTAATTLLLLGLASLAAAEDNGRLYGTIYTVDGDTFEGMIRWDKNEAHWVDILNGTKELRSNYRNRASERRKYGERRKSIKIFGVKIGESDNDFRWTGSAESGMRFGHIKTMEVIDDDRVLLTLKSGHEVELSDNSTDIGSGIREILLEERDEGEIEFSWDDIEKIEFEDTRGGMESSLGERLYGTLTTRRGDEFTGFVCWDVDELFTSDVIDGNEKRRKRKVKFGTVQSISRYSSSGAQLVLKNGDEMVLRGSNDVDNDNRGIIISDPGFGQVRVQWDEFEELVFKDIPSHVTYDQFDGGRLLKGTVFTEDGDSYKGTIIWDSDEEYTWEIIDGEYRDLEYDIEFGLIKQIEKNSYRSAEVTVWDGRTFRLRGSNDVDEDNKGIIITLADGDEVVVDWDEFEKLELEKP
ncbi:MAG: hypothetical protein GY867_02575 [bacterium]|nr:hypothetical protein [bacterium]